MSAHAAEPARHRFASFAPVKRAPGSSSWPPKVARGWPATLDLQTCFTRGVGQSLHLAVEQETTTVEVSFFDALGLGAFGNGGAHFGSGFHTWPIEILSSFLRLP